MPAETVPTTAAPRQQLSLFDVVCIIVGIIIGSGIYSATPLIAQKVSGPGWLIFAWTLGGLIALVGALCYAELTTTYPAHGGDYVFLTKAYGRRMGFLFTWTEFWITRPGNVGAVAYVFAEYARQLWPFGTAYDLPLYAGGAVAVITLINVLGVEAGKWVQNLLTAIKVTGLLAIFVVGFLLVAPPQAAAAATPQSGLDFRLAIVLIMFAYGGWKDISYVAAEVRSPEKNLLRGLVLGTVAVTLIYLLVNAAFLRGLGFEGVRESQAVAAELLNSPPMNDEISKIQWRGPDGVTIWKLDGGRIISLLICISCLGAMNGMILTGARIYYALGIEHRLYAWLGHWNHLLGAPVRSLLLQGAVTTALVLAFAGADAFQNLVILTGPFFWFFMVLVGLTLFILRKIDPHANRTYRVILYPLTPAIFCLSSAFMIYSSVAFLLSTNLRAAMAGLFIVATGLAVSLFDRQNSATAGKHLEKTGKQGNDAGP